MKNIFVFLFIVFSNFLNAQNNFEPFTKFKLGAYTGINFEQSSEVGGNFIVEGKTNLISDINLNLSFGYYRSFETVSNIVKTNYNGTINGIAFFHANEYKIYKKEYNVLPFSIGLQYAFENQIISPYLLLNASYNFIIDTKNHRTGGITYSYNSFEQIPDEYKTNNFEPFPESSYGASFGIGALIKISSVLDLDLRYFYKTDSEIINTHHFVAGITF
ncbi:MAG: hypothetical protein F9K45_07445 [Melioribacteraceae bacterium]|nr:MAG: hypothetical protein F9K45_07445 [Melioribacteraceae bacterium]